MSLGVFLRVCVSVPEQAVPLQASSIAPLTSRSVNENVEVIDQSHQGDGRAGFQLLQQLGKTLAHFFYSVVTHEALHLLEQCRVSSSFLLCEPAALTEAQSSL